MYLGLDLGTSSLKAVLVDEAQTLVAEAEARLAVSRSRPGWSEQDPSAWIAAAETVLDDVARRHPGALARCRAVGLSGQMHGAVLLDRDDAVIRPAILWDDVRADEEARELDRESAFRDIFGNIVFAGFTAPKIVWTARREPRNFERLATILLPKDYLRLWLTGERASDMSDASGTAWLDVGRREWSDVLLARTGIGRTFMPALVEGTEISGTLRPELAARWGMAAVPVAGGAGDNAASACGVGTVEAGSAFLSLGTSGVLFAANDSFLPNPRSAVHAFCHAIPGRWHQMGVMLAAGGALRWFADLNATEATALERSVDPDRCDGPIFLPYLAGERTPHNDAAIRGSFVGLDYASDRDALARAVMEGVAFGFADLFDALAAGGTRIERALGVGGGARSSAWLQMIADTLGIPVDVPAVAAQGAAFGAARLAIAAREGVGGDTFAPVAIAATVEPSPVRHEKRRERLRRYRALYPAIGAAMRG